MSTYWSLWCETCDDLEPDIYENHGEDLLSFIWRQRNIIVAVAHAQEPGMFYDMRVDIDPHGEISAATAAWLEAHQAHAVCIRNEYGRTEEIPAAAAA